MQRLLSLEQTPPLSVPLRFFLTAPLFAMAAGAVLFLHGPEALLSRWTPSVLAMTHMLTLGFLGLVMMGALMQILPVVAGVEVEQPVLTALATHGLLMLGTIALFSGFLSGKAWLFQLAFIALATGFFAFLLACWLGMRSIQTGNVTLKSARLALLALLFTVIAGLAMLIAYAWGLTRPALPLTTLHVTWGLGGWIGLLIAGVAYQVVPMFQITPIYPAWMTRWLTPGIFTTLAAASLLMLQAGQAEGLTAWVLQGLAALGYLLFGVMTIRLLRKRKRPQPEATTLFWYASQASLVVSGMLYLITLIYPSLLQLPAYPLVMGALFIVGFACAVTNGMLYKIVPFLAWYHLQECMAGVDRKAPNIKQFIPERRTRMQFACHLLSLGLLLAACVWPERLASVAGAAFIASSLLLWMNLLAAIRIYRAHLRTAKTLSSLKSAPDAS